MLQAHSLLWNYLWIAPNILLLSLGLLIWKRGLARQFPAFLVFAIVSAVGDLAAFIADIAPSVSAVNFWRVFWAGILVESLLKFVVIGEVFSRVLKPYPSVGRFGRVLISGFGAVLVFVAALAAAYAHTGNTARLISGFHILEQTVFIVELGLVIFVFLFASYFRLSWDRLSFGVLLGFGFSACGYLAAWAIVSNADPSTQGRTLLDFLEMGIYHFCVLIWCYYLLVPQKSSAPRSAPALPEHNLELWNRELERLLQQ
jgi:hypothetical protein